MKNHLNAVTISVFLIIFLAGNTCVAGEVSTVLSRKSDQKNFSLIISKLADYKNFWMKISELDVILRGVCKKTKQNEGKFVTVAHYRCDPQSGIGSVDIDSQERGRYKYVVSLELIFESEKINLAEKIITRKLGIPSEKKDSYIQWNFRNDSELAKRGDPVIFLSKSSEKNYAGFYIQVMMDN